MKIKRIINDDYEHEIKKKKKECLFLHLNGDIMSIITKHLSLSDINSIFRTNKGFEKIFDNVENITIHFKSKRRFNLKKFNNIKHIKLTGCDSIYDHSKDLRPLLNKKVESINIDHIDFKNVNMFIFKLLFNNKKTLKTLITNNNFNSTESGKNFSLLDIFPVLVNLEYIDIDFYGGILEMKNIKHLNKLKTFKISFIYQNFNLNILPDTIEELSLHGCIYMRSYSSELKYFKNLRTYEKYNILEEDVSYCKENKIEYKEMSLY